MTTTSAPTPVRAAIVTILCHSRRRARRTASSAMNPTRRRVSTSPPTSRCTCSAGRSPRRPMSPVAGRPPQRFDLKPAACAVHRGHAAPSGALRDEPPNRRACWPPTVLRSPARRRERDPTHWSRQWCKAPARPAPPGNQWRRRRVPGARLPRDLRCPRGAREAWPGDPGHACSRGQS